MSKRRHTLALSLMAALCTPTFAQDAAVKALIEQGQYWQSQGNSDRANEAWQKVLRLNPNSPEAFQGLALVEIDNKRFDAAERHLEQLRRLSPKSPLITKVEQALTLARNAPKLQNARELAKSGKPAEAVATYQAALGTQAPKGSLALEYYQTLGGTAQGWDAARKGLEQLASDAPEDGRIALALAQHLTYRESTRREGIQQLARLSNHPDVGAAATDSWRKALAWAGTRGADLPLYQAFLRANPGDAAIQARVAEIERLQRQTRSAEVVASDPLRKRTQEAFKALEEGDLAAAESTFLAVLDARPSDGDALGGLGVLRLRQENFPQAREYLERASRQGQTSRWKSALDSATYWTLIGQAKAAREEGNFSQARQLLQQAVKLDERELTAENDLADLLAESGQYDAAEAGYRRVLNRQSDNPDAVRGLIGVLAQNNKADEALKLIERLTPAQQERVGALGRLRATQALGQAKAAADRGDDTGARVALENALLHDPANPWVRLDLARLYIKLGAMGEARGIMDGLLISNPNMPEALYAHALLASETQDWTGALATLERIPETNRTRDIAALHKRVWVQVQARTASTLAQEGRQQDALALLGRAEPFAANDAELLGALALAYTDAGDTNRALASIRQLMARAARPDPGLRLQYAAILLKTRQDVELAGILRQLQSAPLTTAQRKSYEDLRLSYIVRQADGLREAGDLAAAYDVLAPVLAERPDDPQVIGALARMYAANRDHAQAVSLYNRLLERDPNNLQLLLPAANLAIEAREFAYAESALQMALLRAPQNPEVLTATGRLYRAQGKTSKATEYFAAAVAAENQLRQQQLAASGALVQARSSNPFAARPGTNAARAGFLPGPVPAAVPVAGGLPPAPVALPAARTTAATLPQPYIPEPAGSNRQAMAWAAASVPAPPAPPTPANYLPATYQPAPLGTSANERVTPASRGNNVDSRPDAKATSAAASRRTGREAPARSAPSTDSRTTSQVDVPTPVYTAAPDSYVASATPASPAGWNAPPLTPTAWDTANRRTSPSLPQPVTTAPRSARDDLNDIQQERIPVASIGVVARVRTGESGMSQLTDLETPLQLKMDAGDGKLALRITPVSLSSGTPDTSYGTLSRFGGGPATTLALPDRSVGNQSASGIGLAVGYETDRLKMDVGTTPLGFRRADITGGVKFKVPVTDDFSMSIDASRRPVTDSLLSFAGARDPRTGADWGGVSSTGARVDLTWDTGDFGVYGYGSLHGLTGTQVATNSRVEGGGGLYWRVSQDAHSGFTTGLNFTALSYDKNLRYFTLGHGGYFSPQRFLSLNVPMEWAQRTNKLSYQLKGSLGVQHFKENAAAYFPTNANLQSAAAQAANDAFAFGTAGATANGAIYPGQTKTGLGYNLGAALEYQIHPQLFFGGHLALDNARDYRQFMGGIYVRYALQPYSGLQALPLNPVRSPYASN